MNLSDSAAYTFARERAEAIKAALNRQPQRLPLTLRLDFGGRR